MATPKSLIFQLHKHWDVIEHLTRLYSVNIFSSSPTRISVNPRKVYGIDHALAASVSSGILSNRDNLMENMVFTALRRVTPDIFYHKTKTGREVDLVALLPSGPGERAILLI